MVLSIFVASSLIAADLGSNNFNNLVPHFYLPPLSSFIFPVWSFLGEARGITPLNGSIVRLIVSVILSVQVERVLTPTSDANILSRPVSRSLPVRVSDGCTTQLIV